jgi:hypothetical protein
MAVMAVAVLIGVAAVNAFGQETATKTKLRDKERSFCTGNNWSTDGVSFRDLREMTLPATSSLTVDAGRNGGIHIIGSERNEIVLRACVQAWGATEDAAKAAASGVRISTAGTIKAEGADEKNMSVSFQLLVPRNTSVNLSARNGGISISGTDGTTQFETVNGGVHISMPNNYAAHLIASTVNGGFHSGLAALPITNDKHSDWNTRTRSIDTNINGGGATIKVTTSNGGVHIGSDTED